MNNSTCEKEDKISNIIFGVFRKCHTYQIFLFTALHDPLFGFQFFKPSTGSVCTHDKNFFVTHRARDATDLLLYERTYAWFVPQMISTGMCLGPDGFGACDAKSLWILAYTNPTKKTKAIVSMLAPEPEKMCLGSSSSGVFSSLRRVGVSK